MKWVAMHRRHHQHSDEPEDPHSPHGHGAGLRGVLVGFWQAHLGWLFAAHPPHIDRYVRDIAGDRGLRMVSNLFGLWVLLGLLAPAALAGVIWGSWTGAFLGFLWGGLVRVFLLHHTTWSINSVCHLWGSQPYPGGDESRNNAIFGILGFGEGWHNNHHAFPNSARHGLRWWQFDLSYLVIRGLAALGLAWHIRLPAAAAPAARNAA
jgi:stearoyl-CoA desaturase (delta-9 desaturase)